MAIRIQLRKVHPNVWDSADPTLAAGEFGFAWDSADSASFGRLKIGDGSTSWTNLPYFYSAGDSAGNYAGAGGSAGIAWGGDRGLAFYGYSSSSYVNTRDYFDITTLGNASDFGDATTIARQTGSLSDTTYGLQTGGYFSSTPSNVIDYVMIATPGNASDFGDLVQAKMGCASCSDGTTGLIGGGHTGAYVNTIDYITVASPGNAADFGDLTTSRRYLSSSSNSTYGVWAGGTDGSGDRDEIDYVTIATTSNASDFGDLINAMERMGNGTASDETYGIFLGGQQTITPTHTDTIQYITFATPSNATDFGDLLEGVSRASSTGNGSRGVGIGGYPGTGYSDTIQYFTIATPGNAADLGDLVAGAYFGTATSGSPS